MGNKPTAILFAMMLISTSAHSQSDSRWTVIRDDAEDATFVDLVTMKRTGEIVKAWFLTDRKAPFQAEGYITNSAIVLREYNCDDRMTRVLFFAEYRGRMASGGTGMVVDEPNKKWRPILPDSVGETSLNFVCKPRGKQAK